MAYSKTVIDEAGKLKDADVEQYICRELSIKTWIEDVLSIKIDESLGKALQSGIILCYLSSEIHPGSIPAIHEETNNFYHRKENVVFFIGELEDLGMAKREIFRVEDILETVCTPRVVFCLEKYVKIAEEKKLDVKVKPRPLEEFAGDAAKMLSEMEAKSVVKLKRDIVVGRLSTANVSGKTVVKMSPLVAKKQIEIALGGANAGKSIYFLFLFFIMLIY